MLFSVKTVLLVLGILRALVTLQNILRFLYEHMLPSTVSLKQKYPAKAKGKRPWALITGSSDGIGAEYARYLAQGGFNLILVSRDADKLKAVTEDIKYAYPSAETKVIQVDFTRESALHPAFFQDLRKQVNDLDISIVIACAGCFSMGRFEKTPGKYLEAMLDVNIYHNIMMSKVFMPMLIEQRSSKEHLKDKNFKHLNLGALMVRIKLIPPFQRWIPRYDVGVQVQLYDHERLHKNLHDDGYQQLSSS